MEVSTHSTQETKRLAKQIAEGLKPGDVLALYGELGSGKTTFTNFLVKALGISDRVFSPTFVIARRYGGKINHIDLYRLTTKKEVLDTGFEEFLNDKDSINIIEWPELVKDLLPAHTIKIRFEETGENSRKIYVQNLH